MLQCIILDMDGTLLDTEPVYIQAWRTAGRQYGFDLPEDFIIHFFGMNEEKINQLFLEHFGPDFPIAQVRAARTEYSCRYFQEHPVPVKPGAEDLLRCARRHGVTSALATSTYSETALPQLKQAGLYDLLDYFVTGEMVSRSKPEPDIFLKAMECAHCRPEDSLIVEDSGNGVRGAAAAGCRCIMVPDLIQPDKTLRPLLFRCCRSLTEVAALLDAELL